MRPILPRHDPDPEGRSRELAERRSEYTYDPSILPPFVLFHRLPREELFSLGYFTERLASSAELPANLVAVKLRTIFDPFDRLDDYDDLFTLLPRPAIAERWREDASFAEQRVAGTETRMIRRLGEFPDNLRIEPALLAGLLGEPGERALAEGRLFVADYALLDGIPGGMTDARVKFVYAPIALFHRRAGEAGLRPVAIQLEQRPRPGNLYTPSDGDHWLLAKIAVQAADYTLSMMAHHVQRVHLGLESVAMATARQLARRHPVAILLRPHLHDVMVQEELSRRLFVNPGGYIERLFAPTLEGSLEIAARSQRAWDFGAWGLERDLAERGVDDPANLPHYPFRDDGRLVHAALARYVAAHLERAYPDEAELAADVEIRAWIEELVDPARGTLKGLPTRLERAALAGLLTEIIFLSGPYHSSLNYRQPEYAAYVPNLPMALYGPIPTDRGPLDEASLLEVLPPQRAALGQLEIIKLLTDYQPDRLGCFPEDDPLVRVPELAALGEALRRELDAAEVTIGARNRGRAIPYTGMVPSRIL
ncbi:MAG: hypothetical protein KC420_18925, partial [Myxococcales bacterium]|nr:hypothetical protein [Myxococcales bacterium]